MNRLKANWELGFFYLQNAEVERKRENKAVLVFTAMDFLLKLSFLS